MLTLYEMITATDPKLAAALKNLRSHADIGPIILNLEKAGYDVTIRPTSLENSITVIDKKRETVFEIGINSKGDDILAKSKWGITGTNEENSIAHELGHVYWRYMYDFQKKKPLTKPAGSTKSQQDWDNALEETQARRFDNFTRPRGTIVPTVDTAKPTVFSTLFGE